MHATRLDFCCSSIASLSGRCPTVAVPDLLTDDMPAHEAWDCAVIEAWTGADYARRELDQDAEIAGFARSCISCDLT